MIWLMRILNAVVELETIPKFLKRGIVVPDYKGGGGDPMKVDSYRSITLTSMVLKVLELHVVGTSGVNLFGSRSTTSEPICI